MMSFGSFLDRRVAALLVGEYRRLQQQRRSRILHGDGRLETFVETDGSPIVVEIRGAELVPTPDDVELCTCCDHSTPVAGTQDAPQEG